MNYWNNALRRRLSRRRMLSASAAAAGAGIIVACGGSDKKPPAAKDRSGLLATPTDTSKEAKRGGILKHSFNQDVLRWDPHTSAAWFGTFGGLLWSRLFILKPGVLQPSDGEVAGDLVESWEWSPDRLQLTMKLRQNAGWAPLAPVNGRKVTTEDVVASWDRYAIGGVSSSDFVNAKNPDAPVLSLSAPDSRTVVSKLAYPMVTLLALLAVNTGGYFHLLPREVDSGFDARREPIGSGPFYLSEQVPSARFVLKRNPNYYDAERPYLDSVEYPLITEYAAGLAQLNAGGIYTYAVRPEDTIETKRRTSDLAMYATEVAASGTGIIYGYKGTERGIFRDERLRQAYSMSIDRDLFIDVAYNVSSFEKEGLPMETRWSTASPANDFEGWWLDPKDKNFGANAKYFQHNVSEAKKLITAAAYPSGLDYMSNYQTTAYGASYVPQVQIIEGMANEAGFRPVQKIWDYTTEFQPMSVWGRGDFEGLSYKAIAGGATDALERLSAMFHPGAGITFLGFDPDGKGTFAGDPWLTEQIKKSRGEVDAEKRKAIVHEIQRYVAKTQYVTRYPGGANGFDLAWPAVQNFGVFNGDPRGNFYYWLDETKAPVRKA